MNKYLACVSLLAICFCLNEAATINEVERLIQQASQQARTQMIVSLKTATRDTLARSTTQQQRACVTSKISAANREINAALHNEITAMATQYRNRTPQEVQQLDVNNISLELQKGFTSSESVAQGWVNQINQCA